MLPINEESMERSWFITDWAHPRGLLLIHHKVRGAVEALEMCAGARPRRNRHPHLTKLYTETKTYCSQDSCAMNKIPSV